MTDLLAAIIASQLPSVSAANANSSPRTVGNVAGSSCGLPTSQLPARLPDLQAEGAAAS